ncbi:MAG: hypothetical protein HQ463_01880 [Bacteroidetes bacterium]|nr:hypothetical protein [Bacteroidota bacterium]
MNKKTLFAFIGGVIVLLSLLGFIQYSQLLINNSKNKIKTLLYIGFYHQSIFRKYFTFS